MPLCAPDVAVAPLEGRYGEAAPGSVGLLFRYALALDAPTTLAAHLSISGEDMRAATRLYLLDKATRAATPLPGGRLHATELAPNGGAGYALIALYDAGPRGVAEEGSYCLTLTSSSPLPPGCLVELPCGRCEAFAEAYRPNGRHVLSRHVLTCSTSTSLALVAAAEPRLPFTLTLQEALTGREVTWAASKDYPQLVAARAEGYGPEAAPSAPPRVALAAEGSAVLPDVSLKPGKYLVSCTLDAALCPPELQPDVLTGALPTPPGAAGAPPVKLRLWALPSADEKACTVLADSSLAKYVQSVYDKWNAAPVALIAQPAPGAAGKGAKPGAAAGGGAAGKPPPGGRAAVAAGLLESHRAEAAPPSVSQTGAEPGEPAGGVTRVLRDGSVLELDPVAQLIVARSEPAQRISPEQLAERAAAAAARAAQEAAAALEGVARALVAGKDERAGFRARQAAGYAELRAAALVAQRDAAGRRAAVAQGLAGGAVAASAAPSGAEAASPSGAGRGGHGGSGRAGMA
jgi:hypothetical protein